MKNNGEVLSHVNPGPSIASSGIYTTQKKRSMMRDVLFLIDFIVCKININDPV